MGENPEAVFNTGCPSIDLAKIVAKNPSLDFDPIEKYGGVGPDIKWGEGYIVVLHHPVTTEFNDSSKNIESLLSVVDGLGIPTFWFWPNVDEGSDAISKGIRMYREAGRLSQIRFYKNMDTHDFLLLLHNSSCLIGNSSVGIREGSFLGTPVVNVGDRQANRERGVNTIDVSCNTLQIVKAVIEARKLKRLSQHIYGDGNAGKRIATILDEIEFDTNKVLSY